MISPPAKWIQSPQLVDDGRAVLFTQRINERDWSGSNIVVQDLASGTLTTLVQGGTDGRALPGGLLIYARENALFAVAFDSRKRETSGPTVPLERGVLPSVGGFTGASQMTWSPSGSLAYAVDDMAADSSLTWMTRQGGLEPTALPARPQFQGQRSFALSPDGKRVAIRVMGTSRSQTDVWIGDIGRGTFTRLTSSGTATDPQWTADGSRLRTTESTCHQADARFGPLGFSRKHVLPVSRRRRNCDQGGQWGRRFLPTVPDPRSPIPDLLESPAP